MFNITTMQIIDLTQNNLIGNEFIRTVPRELANLIKLITLHLGAQYLEGEILEEPSNLEELQVLGLVSHSNIQESVCGRASNKVIQYQDPIPINSSSVLAFLSRFPQRLRMYHSSQELMCRDFTALLTLKTKKLYTFQNSNFVLCSWGELQSEEGPRDGIRSQGLALVPYLEISSFCLCGLLARQAPEQGVISPSVSLFKAFTCSSHLVAFQIFIRWGSWGKLQSKMGDFFYLPETPDSFHT
ncbi:hypothetical protein HAX54_034092 [Datura stramonium]|uniref:Uncharacterized protein n=1 Tax=Datura stramonium TaxID=4076 RepID=A0ABS8VDI5_DATST|nr:hypothetical protein [Datura stramonium]